MEITVEATKLTPGRKQRLGDQLYGQILEQIISGVYPEGSKLPSEIQLCRAMQVSRPTVREALMRLQADGLVTTRQGSGTFVQKRPPGELTQFAYVSDIAALLRCMEVRMTIEARAAGLAAERRTTAELQRIERALKMLRDEPRNAKPEADFEFHLAIADACGNELFAQVLESLSQIVMETIGVAHGITRAGSQERTLRVIEEHEAIVEAIRRQDAEGASLSMRYHLYCARRRVTDGKRKM